jgi:hypothetical protein
MDREDNHTMKQSVNILSVSSRHSTGFSHDEVIGILVFAGGMTTAVR